VLNIFIAVILDNYELSGDEVARLLHARKSSKFTFFHHVAHRLLSVGFINEAQAVRLITTKTSPNSLNLFGKRHPLRVICTQIIDSNFFQAFIICCIVLSSFSLMLETPPSVGRPLLISEIMASRLNDFLFVTFAIEMGLNVISKGLVQMEGAYLRSPWNVLDLFVLLLSVAEKVMSGSGIARVFRLGRVLRPLRAMKRNKDMKFIIESIFQSATSMGYILILGSIIFIIFGVVSLSLFMGRFTDCNDSDMAGEVECIGHFQLSIYSDAMLPVPPAREVEDFYVFMPRVWYHAPANYDNIFQAMSTLFRVTTLNWSDIFYWSTDMAEAGMRPEVLKVKWPFAFYIAFIMVAVFFWINLFVGVIIAYFSFNEGTMLLAEEQKWWLQIQKEFSRMRPKPTPAMWDHDLVRKRIMQLIEMRWFRLGTQLVIVFNVSLLVIQDKSKTGAYMDTILALNNACSAFYWGEVIAKVTAYGVSRYVKDAWNIFDVVLVLGTFLLNLLGGTFLVFERLFRVVRIMRLLNAFRTIRKLVMTLFYSMSSLFNVTLLMLISMVVFGVLGVNLFGETRTGLYLGRTTSFRNVFQALLSLFQIVAGDDWGPVADEANIQPPFCTMKFDGKEYGDCGSPYAFLYFVAFVILLIWILLNVFAAVVILQFVIAFEEYESGAVFNLPDLDRYLDVWSEYDSEGSGYIHSKYLRPLLLKLGPPLGLSVNDRRFVFLVLRAEVGMVIRERAVANERNFLHQLAVQKLDPARAIKMEFYELGLILMKWRLKVEAFGSEEREARYRRIARLNREAAQQMIRAQFRGWKFRKIKERRMQQLAQAAQETRCLLRVNSALSFSNAQLMNQTIDGNDDGMTASESMAPLMPSLGAGIELDFDFKDDAVIMDSHKKVLMEMRDENMLDDNANDEAVVRVRKERRVSLIVSGEIVEENTDPRARRVHRSGEMQKRNHGPLPEDFDVAIRNMQVCNSCFLARFPFRGSVWAA
jgi:hypothetical protein